MIAEVHFFVNFVVENLIRIWPYLLITIPIAVAVQLSGASHYIRQALSAKPVIAIVLATAVGAFSPFCSCTVIPVVAALLIGGVPLAPVMAFWVASPSMDPEIFFLSVATIGWEMALWRLAATIVLSLGAGYVTHFATVRHWLGDQILREQANRGAPSLLGSANMFGTTISARVVDGIGGLRALWRTINREVQSLFQPVRVAALLGSAAPGSVDGAADGSVSAAACGSCAPEGAPCGESTACGDGATCNVQVDDACSSCGPACSTEAAAPVETFRSKLWRESWAATTLVLQFMLLAFVLEALIVRYVPAEWITQTLGQQNPLSILLAALLGVPVYTSNLAALPMVGGLLAQGMAPAAGLAFLIAGPTTTLPAMAAVWQLASRRVFALYVAFALVGAVLTGYIYQIAHLF